jgi:hypothetical protein
MIESYEECVVFDTRSVLNITPCRNSSAVVPALFDIFEIQLWTF